MTATSSNFLLESVKNSEIETLARLLETLRSDPSSRELDDIVSHLGFSQLVAEELRENPQFLDFTLAQLEEKLQTSKKHHLEIVIDDREPWFRKAIVNDTLTAYQMMLLAKRPDFVEELAKKWKLPRTRNLDDLLKDFRSRKYTRRCANYNLDRNFCMRGAAMEGHMDIVQLMLSRGATDYDAAMASAAKNGHMDIVQLMLEWGATDYNRAMVRAAKNGQMDIVQLMLDRGATDYNNAMAWAAGGGQMKIVKLMMERGANNYDWVMERAAEGGHMKIVKLMMAQGATNYDRVMVKAAKAGHMDIVQLMLERGATDYDEAMVWAAGNGHMDIVQLMLERGATDYNMAMAWAARAGHMDIVELIRQYRDTR